MLNQRIPVLDKGWIELQDLMPHPLTGITPDAAIVSAARVSFLGESKGAERDARLIHRLMERAHTSPFEMVEYKFRVYAPLLVYWQWVRHRTFTYQSVNSQSGRYTEFDGNSFHVPSIWRRQSKSNKQGSDGPLDNPGPDSVMGVAYAAHLVRCIELYEMALRMGVAREQARLFLPGFAVYYTWVVKVDLWNLLRFIQLRLADDAQHEIREYAKAMWQVVQATAPVTAAAAEQYMFKWGEGG